MWTKRRVTLQLVKMMRVTTGVTLHLHCTRVALVRAVLSPFCPQENSLCSPARSAGWSAKSVHPPDMAVVDTTRLPSATRQLPFAIANLIPSMRLYDAVLTQPVHCQFA